VSRLDFAPKLDDVEIVDVPAGLGTFAPKPEKAVSFAQLKATLKKAGYKLDSAHAVASGIVSRSESGGLYLTVSGSGQRLQLIGVGADSIAHTEQPQKDVELKGRLVTLRSKDSTEKADLEALVLGTLPPGYEERLAGAVTRDTNVFAAATAEALDGSTAASLPLPSMTDGSDRPLPSAGRIDRSAMTAFTAAPIRTTSPGLTVFQGGAVIPRFSSARYRLPVGESPITVTEGSVTLTNTPFTTTQFELSLPYRRAHAAPGGQSLDENGIGLVSVAAKYRFFRQLWRWGDRQAAVRIAGDLPVTRLKHDAPAGHTTTWLQLFPGSMPPALRLELTASQAYRRVIVGASAEQVMYGERNDVRLANEFRANLDLEYVLLPLRYRRATHELFVVLETSVVQHSSTRNSGVEITGSDQHMYLFAPGLQYVLSPRLTIDASYQRPFMGKSGDAAPGLVRSVQLSMRRLY
jgi:hypothetical protein